MFNNVLESVNSDPTLQVTLSLFTLVATSFLSFFLIRKILIRSITFATKNVSNLWAQCFLDKKLLSRASWLIPILIFHTGLNAISNLNEKILIVLQRSTQVLHVIFFALTLTTLLDCINNSYSKLPVAKNRPIKGILQLFDIIIYAAALILIFSIVLDKTPWFFLSGLGAMTAILLLIFKDTILSLVAGIQITTNDFIRVGDWIEMPQFGADGDVVDIALHAVRVQNWDKTITIIPTHKFLENSYKNWRGMSDSGGRRIKRAIYIDIGSIRFLEKDEIERLKAFKLIREYLDNKNRELVEVNKDAEVVNHRRLTNVGTFRAYLTNYLKHHPKTHKEMTLMVRQLSPGPNGLPIEIYVFTNTTKWADYEGIQADIFDHIFAIAPEFGLRVFQEPTGANFESLLKSNSKTSED